MSPFTIAIIIGIILIVISIITNPNFFILSPLFVIGSIVSLAGIGAHLRKWWSKGYN